MIRTLLGATALALTLSLPAAAQDAIDPADWPSVEAAARGQTVHFNAWGGSEAINDYIEWASGELEEQYGVTINHVKLTDTAEAVSKVVAERAAGRGTEGSVDLIWINGENFVSMKDQGLILSPDWTTALPNWPLVDTEGQPTVLTDFTVPTEGLESPWGGAKLTFFHDSAVEQDFLPDNANDLLDWAKDNPGRFSYPAPPDFVGSSFLKQLLIELTDDPAKLREPVDPATLEADLEPLFNYLDELHPVLWRQARAFPQNYPDMRQKLADGELDIIFAFNPGEASAGIRAGELPDTVRSFTFSGGTLGNTHFLTVPYNAANKAGALVVANFMLSPEAQARKSDPDYWGDPTVLNVAALPEAERALFEAVDLGEATLAPEDLGPRLDEPHATWMGAIERAWTARYGTG